jgi:hypothetical protein
MDSPKNRNLKRWAREVDFPGFSGHFGVFVRIFRIPQDLRRLNDYDGTLDYRRNQCSQISRPAQARDPEFNQSELGELLRMEASINDGYGSATSLLERFGSAARNSRLHRAGTQWGQW